MTAPRLKTCTLGCKVNQYETEYVREGLLSIGYQDAIGADPAALCLVNTCTVTREGEAKSRQAIRRLARENPAARIVVMGCYATRAPQEVAALPGVVDVVTDKRQLPQLLMRLGITDVPTGIARFGDRHRAYLKVQDGCRLRCSYCIIPYMRPHVLSRPVTEILDEVRRLRDNGYRELVLTGVHLGHYGIEGVEGIEGIELSAGRPAATRSPLAQLVRQIARLDGNFRLRLSSLEATEVTRELVETVAEFPDKICPHFHICLQSGSDQVLRRMRRRWGARLFQDRCRFVRDQLPLPALTTDVIVGFPGETDADFAATCRVVQDVGFSKIHVFPFSPREGPPAAEMPDQVPASVKAARRRHLSDIAGQLRRAYFQQLIGRPLRVLVESHVEGHPDRCAGTACRYAPVELPGSTRLSGQLVTCRPHAVHDSRLLA